MMKLDALVIFKIASDDKGFMASVFMPNWFC